MTEPVRSCAVCRSALERDEAVRIVLDPEGAPAIDWRGKLPGRGASCCYSKACLQALSKRGALSRAFKQEVAVPSKDWPMPELLAYSHKRQRELIGLASRAGELKSGGNVVERLLGKGWVDYLVKSSDVGPSVASQWNERATRSSLQLLASLLDSQQLGGALGKEAPRSVLGVRRGPLARSLLQELKRGQALI